MAFLLCRKNIAHGKLQQEDHYRCRAALALPMPLSSRYGLWSLNWANSTQYLCATMFTVLNRFD